MKIAVIAGMAGIRIPLQPGPGVMVSVLGQLTQRVINRLQPAGEGDIIVPERGLSILGTTAWLADDPDTVSAPPKHVRRLLDLCGMLVPAVRGMQPYCIWSAIHSELLKNRPAACDSRGVSRANAGASGRWSAAASVRPGSARRAASRICGSGCAKVLNGSTMPSHAEMEKAPCKRSTRCGLFSSSERSCYCQFYRSFVTGERRHNH